MRSLIALASGLALLSGAYALYIWTACRVVVGPDECLVVINKSGQALPAGQTIAEPGQRGIQRDVRGPGQYFLIPHWAYEWEKHPATVISAGDPSTWREVYKPGGQDTAAANLVGQLPEVGVVTRLAGKPWTGASEVVDEGYQGIQRSVLTPGVYRLNPYVYRVEKAPAVVVPLGSVGVVTSQLGDAPGHETITEVSVGPDGEAVTDRTTAVQKLAGEGQRGVMKDVLQPGIYYLNPKVHQVKVVQVGFNQISQMRSQDISTNIDFPSQDGFTIGVEITVVWGRRPEHAAEMISRYGDVEKLRGIILGQMRSICRNIGSTYSSTDFIQGERRELYQQAVTETLQRVCRQRDIEILIALIQHIEVHGGTAPAVEGMDLKQTIQRGYIAAEEDVTKQKQRETARVRAELETARAAVSVAREQVSAATRKTVAELRAEGQKKAREIEAQRDLEVAQTERKIAELDAEKTRVLGKANAQVEQLRRTAEADGSRMLIEALGDGGAYNLYTFAQSFQPESIRLIYAGEGTFWTDLSRLQDAASMQMLKSATEGPAAPAVPAAK